MNCRAAWQLSLPNGTPNRKRTSRATAQESFPLLSRQGRGIGILRKLLPVLINPNGYADERVLRVRFRAGGVVPVAHEIRFFELHRLSGEGCFFVRFEGWRC